MKYPVLDTNGKHQRQSRVNRSIRTTDGLYGVNLDRHGQKALRQQAAQARAAFRATLSPQQQYDRISERPGASLREKRRLGLLLQVVDLGST